MPKCVAIEVGDDGAVKVGMLPPEAIGQYAEGMQPAGSLDEALNAVKSMLSGGAPEQAQAAQAQAEGEFRQGFDKTAPGMPFSKGM